jgi:hypothetical protein
MNARVVGVLLVLLAALGGGALLVQQQAGSQKSGDSALGQPLLKDLQAASVASIVIRQPKAALTLAKKDDRWTIAERGGFPADFDKVREFVLKVIAAKIGQSEPIGEKDRARLNLDDSGTVVEFLGADGKPLARLTAGKKYFKAEPENPAKAIGDGRYVALPGDDKRVYVIADPLTQASTKTADWISKSTLGVEKIKSLEVKYADSTTWKVERSGDNADWKLAGARGDEKLEITKANAASYTFGQLQIADLAAKDLKPEDAGLDKPTLVTATTLDGISYALKVGKPEGDNVYATLDVTGEAKPEQAAPAKALAGHIVLIPKSKLEDILKKRAELLVKKEEKKK